MEVDVAAVHRMAERLSAPGATSDVFEALGTMRAMRHLSTEPIPDEVVEVLVWAGSRAASPHNTQGWHFIAVTDPTIKADLADRIAPVLRERARARATVGAVSSYAESPDGHLIDTYASLPLLLVVTAEALDTAESGSGEDPFVATTLYLASQNILLAARAMGFGAALTTPHVFAERAFRDVLGIPPEIVIGAVIPVGRPRRRFGPVRRHTPERFLHRNVWQNRSEVSDTE